MFNSLRGPLFERYVEIMDFPPRQKRIVRKRGFVSLKAVRSNIRRLSENGGKDRVRELQSLLDEHYDRNASASKGHGYAVKSLRPSETSRSFEVLF